MKPDYAAMLAICRDFVLPPQADVIVEVNAAATANPMWLDGGYRLNKVFFACHAVSLESGRTA